MKKELIFSEEMFNAIEETANYYNLQRGALIKFILENYIKKLEMESVENVWWNKSKRWTSV